MAVNDVTFPEAAREPLRITFPQQRRFALPVQRNPWIDAGMDVDPVVVEVHQSQSVEPSAVALRNGGGIATIRRQRGIAALLEPESHLRGIRSASTIMASWLPFSANRRHPSATPDSSRSMT